MHFKGVCKKIAIISNHEDAKFLEIGKTFIRVSIPKVSVPRKKLIEWNFLLTNRMIRSSNRGMAKEQTWRT